MKKLTLICMSALLLLAVSCKKDKETEKTGRGFYAKAESHTGNSKTHLDGVAVKWNSGDEILMVNYYLDDVDEYWLGPYRFVTEDANVDLAYFSEAETVPDNFYTAKLDGYIAVYPAENFAFYEDEEEHDGEDIPLAMPAVQEYVEGGFGPDANPMFGMAESLDDPVEFKNICGVLEFKLYSNTSCIVKSISVTTSKANEMLWGHNRINLDDDDGWVEPLKDGGNTITLDCGEGVAMSNNSGAPSCFYLVLPGGTLAEGFTVTVTDINGNTWSKTAPASASNKITRTNITVMPVTEVGAMHAPVVPSTVTLTAGCSSENIYNVGGSVTVPEGEHTCEFGLVYSETDESPTIEGGAQKVVAGTATFSGTKTFSADITGLTAGTTYHVRAYAMIEGVIYSTAKDFSSTPLSLPNNWVNGTSPFPFSVSATRQVYFSQGNLQFIGSAEIPFWKFADHQFDLLGNNGQGSVDPKADRDLFGWGTSNINHGAPKWQPWSVEPGGYYAYGDYTANLFDGEGDMKGKADWGANTIANCGNGWYTLTKDDWDYLIKSRYNHSNLYGYGKVGNCYPGLIILPDDFVLPDGLNFTSGGSNVYNYSEWSKMEKAGAVFLPSSGSRYETTLENFRKHGSYWSSTGTTNRNDAMVFSFNESNYASGPLAREYGCCVRLVKDATTK